MLPTLARTAAIAGLIAVAGCDSKAESPKDKPASTPDAGATAAAKAAPAVAFSGTLRGMVKLAEGATLPLAPLPSDPSRSAVAPGCPEIGQLDRKQVSESEVTHGLSPLHLAITGMTASPPRAPVTHVLEIREDCRLTPGMVAAMTGDTLRVINHSKAPLLPVLPRETFMQALLPGAQRETTIQGIGPLAIKCGLGAYCGESTLLSTAHSLYAITDAEGRFTVTGVPLDQELTVFAWHPLFKPTSATFKLTKDERSKEIELSIQPLTPPEEAPAPTKPTLEAKPAKKKPAK